MDTPNSKVSKIAPRKNKPGAGRKVGTGKFGEPTSVIRIPTSLESNVKDFLTAYQQKTKQTSYGEDIEIILPAIDPPKVFLNLYSSQVPAGFPSPADDHVEKRLDLNEFFQTDKPYVFLARVGGNSLLDLGIIKGDIAIVDRSLPVRVGQPVMVRINEEFTMKIFSVTKQNKPLLLKANEGDPTIENILITDDMDFEIWGVITGAVHKF
ncbi:MAG TPA: S24 family peptidase [Methylotenera sp.]|nr:S24 family peptidase [Methylotenera sp.]HPH06396.1 S24 family peptidase [Methylotenera sp.]HPN01828.1 S24 family peptidase [Methylotenera sp.]